VVRQTRGAHRSINAAEPTEKALCRPYFLGPCAWVKSRSPPRPRMSARSAAIAGSTRLGAVTPVARHRII